MDEAAEERARQRLLIAFDLYEAAEQLVRQRLLRKNPNASAEEIEHGIRIWLRTRPGAEHGDYEDGPADPPDRK